MHTHSKTCPQVCFKHGCALGKNCRERARASHPTQHNGYAALLGTAQTTVVEHELRRRGGQRHFGCVPSGSAPCGATQNYVKLAGFTDHLHDTDLAPGVTGPCGLSACPRGVKRTNPSRSALHVLRRQSPAAWEV